MRAFLGFEGLEKAEAMGEGVVKGGEVGIKVGP